MGEWRKVLNCPYLDCTCENIQDSETRCPNCRRYLKTCSKCSAFNRAFAMYCRNCGAQLPATETNWSEFKGGPQRLGNAGFLIGKRVPDIKTEDIGTFNVSKFCKSLLIYDQYLFAFSVEGEITVADISKTPVKPFISFHAGGNIYAVPAISQGSLYVGTEKYLRAYSLGNLFSEPTAKPDPRWELPVSGTPVRELLPVKDQLYFMTIFPDRHYEICAVKDIQAARIKPSGRCFSGLHVSSLAGIHTDKIRKIYFLSQDQNGTRLHLIDHARGTVFEPEILPVKGGTAGFRKRIPIAVIGAKIFFVLKTEDTLCRLDAHTGEIDSKFCKNVREFSMAGINDPIISTSKGLLFQRIGKKAELGEGQAIRGAPLILKDCAAAVGMRGGAVRLYDIHDPALPLIWSVSENPGEPVTSLAASENIIAAGNEKGLVKLCRLI
jgi:hypothetical protein